MKEFNFHGEIKYLISLDELDLFKKYLEEKGNKVDDIIDILSLYKKECIEYFKELSKNE